MPITKEAILAAILEALKKMGSDFVDQYSEIRQRAKTIADKYASDLEWLEQRKAEGMTEEEAETFEDMFQAGFLIGIHGISQQRRVVLRHAWNAAIDSLGDAFSDVIDLFR